MGGAMSSWGQDWQQGLTPTGRASASWIEYITTPPSFCNHQSGAACLAPTWPWLPALGRHQCPTCDKCLPVETAACALRASTFCHTKCNHFYLPSTALSVLTGWFQDWTHHFQILWWPFSIPHKSREAKFAEHYTAVGQLRTALQELCVKRRSVCFFLWCLLLSLLSLPLFISGSWSLKGI